MFQPIHVLLVEDNPADADLTIETIETLATNQIRPRVSTVVDGCEALDFLRARPPFAGRSLPDLILLDLNLPKKGGPKCQGFRPPPAEFVVEPAPVTPFGGLALAARLMPKRLQRGLLQAVFSHVGGSSPPAYRRAELGS